MKYFAQFSIKVETKQAIMISFNKIYSLMLIFKWDISANLKKFICSFTVLCFSKYFFAACMQEAATFQVGLNSEIAKKYCISGKICKSHTYEKNSKK